MKSYYLRSERQKKFKQILLPSIIIGILSCLVLLYFGFDWFQKYQLNKIGFSYNSISYIDEYGLRKQILEKGVYSKTLEESIVNRRLNKEYFELYYIAEVVDDDLIAAYDRLSQKGYSSELLAPVFQNLTFREITPLLIFDYQEDLSIYIEDVIENRHQKEGFILNNVYYTPYINATPVVEIEGNTPLVNKSYYLPQGHTLKDAANISIGCRMRVLELEKDARDAFEQICKDIRSEHIRIATSSGYRSYGEQNQIYNSLISKHTQVVADTMTAKPGFNEFETGYAVDLVSLTNRTIPFEETDEYNWLMNNAHRYGFILRYPKGYESITNMAYEPTHFTYVGIEIATQIKETSLTYDEYYELYLKK